MAWIACPPASELFRRAGEELRLPLPMRRSVDPLASRELRQLCLEHEIDVVHTHSSRDSWVSYPLHVARWPVVRSRQITNPVSRSLDRSFIYRHGCARVVASAGCIRENLVRQTGVAAERVRVVGEGTDTTRFHPGVSGRAVRDELGDPENVILFGMVAMFRPEKGQRVFIEAASQLLAQSGTAVRFVLVGEGVGARAYEQECRALLEQRFGSASRGPIVMTGYREDIPAIMAALDVLVVPSFAEAQSLVIPQAFATARPVIASRVGGLPELVKHEETGLLVEPGDTGALVAAMARMVNDAEFRKACGARALTAAHETLSFDTKMEQMLSLYREVISTRRTARSARRRMHARVPGKRQNRRRSLPRQLAASVALVAMALLWFGDATARSPLDTASSTAHVGVEGAPLDHPVLSDEDLAAQEGLVPLLLATEDERIIG